MSNDCAPTLFSLSNKTVICWSYLCSPLIALFRLAFSSASNISVENKTTELSHRFVFSDFPTAPGHHRQQFFLRRSAAPRGSKLYVTFLPWEIFRLTVNSVQSHAGGRPIFALSGARCGWLLLASANFCLPSPARSPRWPPYCGAVGSFFRGVRLVAALLRWLRP